MPIKKATRYCFLTSLLFFILSCSNDDKNYSKSYLRGKRIYQSSCTMCHNSNPSKVGILAPNIEDSDSMTIESMILYGKPPKGQNPKWDYVDMNPLPYLIEEVPFLFEYINSFRK